MKISLRAVLAALVILAGGMGLAACGDESDEEAIRDTVMRFAEATADKDYQVICDELVSEELSESVESVGLPCEAAFRQGLEGVKEPTLDIEDITVNRREALVRVRSSAEGQASSQDSLQLVLEGGDWRISSLAEAQPPAPTPTPREQEEQQEQEQEEGGDGGESGGS